MSPKWRQLQNGRNPSVQILCNTGLILDSSRSFHARLGSFPRCRDKTSIGKLTNSQHVFKWLWNYFMRTSRPRNSCRIFHAAASVATPTSVELVVHFLQEVEVLTALLFSPLQCNEDDDRSIFPSPFPQAYGLVYAALTFTSTRASSISWKSTALS